MSETLIRPDPERRLRELMAEAPVAFSMAELQYLALSLEGLRYERDSLERKLEEATTALKFYANRDLWDWGGYLIDLRAGRGSGEAPRGGENDYGGNIAREALARLAGDPDSGSEAPNPKSVPLPVVEVDE